MKEKWKPLNYKNIKPIYEISNMGRIRNIHTGKYRKYHITHQGYYQCNLSLNDGGKKQFRIHRLVIHTFSLFRKTKKQIVNHIDGNKLNNCITNLEWVNYSENNIHAYKCGLRSKGEDHHFSKYSEEYIHKICKMIAEGYSNRDIYKILGHVKGSREIPDLVCRIKRKERWVHISNIYF